MQLYISYIIKTQINFFICLFNLSNISKSRKLTKKSVKRRPFYTTIWALLHYKLGHFTPQSGLKLITCYPLLLHMYAPCMFNILCISDLTPARSKLAKTSTLLIVLIFLTFSEAENETNIVSGAAKCQQAREFLNNCSQTKSCRFVIR